MPRAQRTLRSTPGLDALEAEARAALSRAGVTTGVTFAELVKLSLSLLATADRATLRRVALARQR